MAHTEGTKLAKLYSGADFDKLRQRINGIAEKIGLIRLKLDDSGLGTLKVKPGTFILRLGELERILIDWNADIDKALISNSVEETRERKAKEGHPRK